MSTFFTPKKGRGPRDEKKNLTVEAGNPVTSCSRCAARPVGAASATFFPEASQAPTTAAVVAVLPVPGPPVRSSTEEAVRAVSFPLLLLRLLLLLLLLLLLGALKTRCTKNG